MATHSSTLAWKIPWMEEPGGLQSMESLRVRHDWATSLSCIGEGNDNSLQCSCLENLRDKGAWWAAVYGLAQSWTQLKWLSSSSSSREIFKQMIFRNCMRVFFLRVFPVSLAGKESACNVGDPGLIPESGRFPWRRDRLPTPILLGFPGGS